MRNENCWARPYALEAFLVREITLRSAQVRRISWVRGVRLAGARLSGLLVSAAFRPATSFKTTIGRPAGPRGIVPPMAGAQ